MILEYLMDERKAWLASLATLCKTLLFEVEAALYKDIKLKTCEHTLALCRSIVQKPHRASFIRKLFVLVSGGLTIRQPLKKVLPMLTGLSSLGLAAEESSLFDILLDVPFRLRTLMIGHQHCPPRLMDILARQPSLERLSLAFVPKRAGSVSKRPRPPLIGVAPLPSLVRLSIVSVDHNDVAHIVAFFGSTIVTLHVLRIIGDRCTPACYWPMSIFQDAQLPKLENLKITDIYHHSIRVCAYLR